MALEATIAALIEIIGRTVAFLRERRTHRSRSLDNDVQPVFDNMAKIHEDYREAFKSILAEWSNATTRWNLVLRLRERKWKLQPLRDTIHALIQEFLCSTDNELRCFYEACAEYFAGYRCKPGQQRFRSRYSSPFSAAIAFIARRRILCAND